MSNTLHAFRINDIKRKKLKILLKNELGKMIKIDPIDEFLSKLKPYCPYQIG